MSTRLRGSLLLTPLLLQLAMAPALAQSRQIVWPYSNRFAPTGSANEPWSLLNSAAGASQGGVVEVQGGWFFGAQRIDKPCKLTRKTSDGPVKIGARPLAQTSLRCVAFNARLNGQSGALAYALPLGWADAARAEKIRDYDFGSPDFIGYCEVWNRTWYDNYLKNTPGMPYGIGGFNTCYSSAPNVCTAQHSGLCAVSRWPLANTGQYSYAYNAVGEDYSYANKGWIKGRMEKDGFGIWVYMVHTQADAELASWSNINFYRAAQVDMLVKDIKDTQAANPGDVVVMMGDFNVYGEDRSPGGVMNEYTKTLKEKLQPIEGMDCARHFFPLRTEHTYSKDNSLITYWDKGYDTDTYSGRLDYLFCFPSGNRKVFIEPLDYAVIRATVSPAITSVAYDGVRNLGYNHTDSNLSDHYAVRGDFRIIRTSN
jgi:endonuclease/exonuclease/phosphatase family metal-dependent hydrolase